MRILIIVNAALKNMGSEALVRGLSCICRKKYPNCFISLASNELDFSSNKRPPEIDEYVDKRIYKSQKSVLRFLIGALKLIPPLKMFAFGILHRKVLKSAERSDIVFVVGADNYDKRYGLFEGLHLLNRQLRKKCGKKLILFDCSMEEEHLDKDVIGDINIFDAVTARESMSFANLNKYISKAKVNYYPDPAFILKPEYCLLPEAWVEGNMIGINVSNLIVGSKYGGNRELVMASYHSLMEFIISNSDLSIALIPHVMNNADLSMLRLLYDNFKESKRVILIENESLKSTQVKYLISQCRFFIGARTHSTIAAYSSCIPTLVLGYSIKSRGIAKDLFGTEKRYVIDVSKLQTGRELVEGFMWLQQNEQKIKGRLNAIMPGYKDKTWAIGDFIEKIINE
ncbi:MAG: colanic acid biosynthesis protein [Firmicutes bacterium ADurb.Bin419]|nr:MAG: colanic acid biosynthesis protein [Firmicutes bacterium ADurb.Bin419]